MKRIEWLLLAITAVALSVVLLVMSPDKTADHPHVMCPGKGPCVMTTP